MFLKPSRTSREKTSSKLHLGTLHERFLYSVHQRRWRTRGSIMISGLSRGKVHVRLIAWQFTPFCAAKLRREIARSLLNQMHPGGSMKACGTQLSSRSGSAPQKCMHAEHTSTNIAITLVNTAGKPADVPDAQRRKKTGGYSREPILFSRHRRKKPQKDLKFC